MSRLLVLAALVATACATTDSQARQLRPLAPNGDSPLSFAALGAKYEVPARLRITDHDKQPGMVWFDFTDDHNGCTGAIIFTASSDRKRPFAYVSAASEKDKQNFEATGITTALSPVSHQPMLGEKAVVQVANLSTKTDSAAKAHFGVFVPEQQLTVIGSVFCEDPGFIEPQLHVLGQVINSQQQEARASQASR